MIYLTKFSRYDRRTGEVRISGIEWIAADNFAAAADGTEALLRGMKHADPDCEYAIITIDCTREVRGIDCEGGSRLFETAAEFSARVTPQTN